LTLSSNTFARIAAETLFTGGVEPSSESLDDFVSLSKKILFFVII